MGLTFRLGQVPLAIFTDSSNNVGIGAAANASYKLQVTGATNLTGALTGTTGTFSDIMDITANNSTAINLVLRGRAADSVGQMEFWNNAKSTRYGYIATDSTSMGIVTTQSIPLVLGTNSAERLRITSGGNVGIGTSSPGSLLTLFDSSTPKIAFQNSGAVRAAIQADSSSLILNSVTGNDIRFQCDSSEKMRITSGGNVLIGQTSATGASNGIYLRTGVDSGIVATDDSSLSLYRLSTNGKILRFFYAGSEVGSISTNTNSLPSDFNFKKDITDISIGLNLVSKLRAVHYRHKLDEDNEPLSNGIIAQELEQSLLDCGIEKNSLLMLQHSPTKDETQSQYWVDYTKMIPVLVKAIQELKAELDELKNK